MATSLLGGAAIGAVFGELLKAVIDMKDRAVMFKPTLAYLTTTLIAIEPVIKEIEQQNNELGRAKAELELLMKEMEEGTKLVYKCSRIHYLNFPARIRYQEQLVALVESLVRFFMIDMQAQTARDLKETLLKVRRIHSAVNKMQLMNSNEENGGGLVPVELIQMDVNESTTFAIQQNDENVTETTDSVPEIAVESETPGNDSAEQVMEDGTRLSHIASQTIEEANNSQEEKHSHDQSYFTDRKRFMGICLPIPPILQKKSGGFNHSEPPSVHAIPRESIIFYEGCPYKFDLEDLLRPSAEVLEETSYATTYKILLKNGTTLVMKRLKDVMIKKQEFEQKIEIVQIISQHPNVLPPLACYCSNDEKLLIYDYMTRGSFSQLLHGANESEYYREAPPLDWDSRMKISLGVAKGLAHIHSLEGGSYVHGNIRSSNVLVTNDHQGCISDLSMIYSLSNSFDQFRYTGYQEVDQLFRPKKIVKLTQKHDVYCFGVLLFEMLSRSLPPARNSFDVIDGIPVVLDKEINGNRDAWKMIKLAENCTLQEPSERPSMDEVVMKMEEILLNPSKVLSSTTLPQIHTIRKDNAREKGNSSMPKLQSQQDNAESSKVEWIKEYQPGVYITITTLPCGKRSIKRVRFGRKRFTDMEAEQWWQENRDSVYARYEVKYCRRAKVRSTALGQIWSDKGIGDSSYFGKVGFQSSFKSPRCLQNFRKCYYFKIKKY